MSKRVSGVVWRFRTQNLVVELELQRDRRYQYDGEDPEGLYQKAIDNGKIIAFDATVSVKMDVGGDGIVLAEDYLGGCTCYADRIDEFWTAHRDPDPSARNCSLSRTNTKFCHYFPDMVREALASARLVLPRRK